MRITLHFDLPDDFGTGWDYRHIHLYPAFHAYAGSYDKDEVENFASDALDRLEGVKATSLYPGQSCTVSFDVDSLEEASALQERLDRLVSAFPARQERDITVRGDLVTEHDAQNPDIEVIRDMPLAQYLAVFVPLAESHPLLYEVNVAALVSQALAVPKIMDAAVRVPAQMSQAVYLELQAQAEAMGMAAAKGQDCTPAFAKQLQEINRLMDAVPWMLHPDHGCVRMSDVAELECEDSCAPTGS